MYIYMLIYTCINAMFQSKTEQFEPPKNDGNDCNDYDPQNNTGILEVILMNQKGKLFLTVECKVSVDGLIGKPPSSSI